jgi:hypothetical protein
MEGQAAQIGRARRGQSPECRLTAWTVQHLPQFDAIRPLLTTITDAFAEYVPDRYAAQRLQWEETPENLRIPGSVFSTLTVNNTFATGFHRDAGDLNEGYSCLAVVRRGIYRGGVLVFGEFRVGVDLQDGDLLLMDAHCLHGNTPIQLLSPDAERISLVCYYRTDLVRCPA